MRRTSQEQTEHDSIFKTSFWYEDFYINNVPISLNLEVNSKMENIDQSILQQIVNCWSQIANEKETPLQTLSVNDVESLFEVLNGHFISRTGKAAFEEKIEVEDKVIDCKECGKMFSTQVNLEKHMMIHNNPDKYMCQKCDKRFISDTGLARHMSKHVESVKCPTCDKMFTSQDYLSQHMTVHQEGRFGKTY